MSEPSWSTRRTVDVDVSWLVQPDLDAVDCLCRLQLMAARRGCVVCLHGANDDLAALVALVGLAELVGLCPCGSTGPARQP